jgi:uncharacterized membrane protein YfhO
MSETFYPGWRVWLDGREEVLAPTDLAFRGLRVTAGVHHVEMRFQPRSLVLGVAITLATLVALVIAGGCAPRKDGRRRLRLLK